MSHDAPPPQSAQHQVSALFKAGRMGHILGCLFTLFQRVLYSSIGRRSEGHLGNGFSCLVVVFLVAVIPLCYHEEGREVKFFLDLEGGVHMIVSKIQLHHRL